jgi:hypothetical protein
MRFVPLLVALAGCRAAPARTDASEPVAESGLRVVVVEIDKLECLL